jgi:TRAP-type transport system periplasmic protein
MTTREITVWQRPPPPPCWEPSRPCRRTTRTSTRVSTVVPAPFPWGLAAERWAELVAERTDGRIKMQIYPGAQLVQGDQTREFTAMRSGVIDMAVGSTINWSPQIAELNIFSLPFLMPDYAALDALTQGPVGERIFELIRENGVVPLAWAENGFREVTNSQRPIRTPGRHAGAEDARRRLADLQRHLHRAGRQPDADELGRRPAGADHRRGRRAGEPADHLHVLNMHELGQTTSRSGTTSPTR